MMARWRITRRGALAAAASFPLLSFAQEDTPIRLLCGLAAGTGNDLAARVVAARLTQVLGRPVVVENRLGAGQRIALNETRRATPNGSVLVLATTGPLVIYPHIYAKLDYDPFNDFTPIAGIASFDAAIACSAKLGARTMREAIRAAGADPQNATFGSPGSGSLSHFCGISISVATKVPLEHVPYKDSGQLALDLVSGRLPLGIAGQSSLMELGRQGKINLLAVSGAHRSALLPDVPTLAESGIAVSSETTVGIFGPAGMDPALVQKLYAAIAGSTEAPDAKARFDRISFRPKSESPEALMAEMHADSDKFAALVKASGYVPE